MKNQAALDRLKCKILWNQDAKGGSHDLARPRLYVADLVYALINEK
jgi:hypothetical protein